MASTERILEHFGYTPEWLRLGVVTASELQDQFAEFETSDDQNKEHYRCAAFRDYLDRIDSIPDSLLEPLLLLGDSGTDGCDLSLNRAHDLVRSGMLSDEQLNQIANRSPHRDQKSLVLAIKRTLIRRQLESDGLTDTVFDAICDLNDAPLTRALLDREDLHSDHVNWIADNGCNKQLRNIAKQLHQSKRFRNGG